MERRQQARDNDGGRQKVTAIRAGKGGVSGGKMDSRRRAVRQGIDVMVKGGLGARRKRSGIGRAASGTRTDRKLG